MKKFLFTGLVISLFAASCKKDDSAPAPAPAASALYANAAAGSSWRYQDTDTSNSPSLTTTTTLSTTRDTTVAGVSYHVYSNTPSGENEYRTVVSASGNQNDYVELFNTNLDGGTPSYFAYIYLKDFAAVNTSWTQNTNLTIGGALRPATILNTIKEKAISKTVNGVTYTDVIHTQSVITSSFSVTPPPPFPPVPVTVSVNVTQEAYYARRFGLIESTATQSISAPGFPAQNAATSRLLLSADLK